MTATPSVTAPGAAHRFTELAPLKRALISVSDKTGLVDVAKALAGRGVELLSTGGSAGLLREAGLEVRGATRRAPWPGEFCRWSRSSLPPCCALAVGDRTPVSLYAGLDVALRLSSCAVRGDRGDALYTVPMGRQS